MLSKADDYPIHQTPEPIAYAGTDRNFYDRYFFNGYGYEGELFFAAAMGVYPHLNIADAAFVVVRDGVIAADMTGEDMTVRKVSAETITSQAAHAFA